MTVGELRKALEGVPGDMEVVLEYDGEYAPAKQIRTVSLISRDAPHFYGTLGLSNDTQNHEAKNYLYIE